MATNDKMAEEAPISDARLFDRSAPISPLEEMKASKLCSRRIRAEELKWSNLKKVPCVQKALLYGSLAGLSVGISRYARIRSIRSAGNWAVIATGLVSVGSWEFCRFQRRLVLDQLARTTVEDNVNAKAALPGPLPTSPQ
ncbi:hypothetical protein SmJEL517_g03724 [Synchytrium microbalum]|uniref:Cytochrome c oxidase assembly protein COX20, mitochondrial n=1 Tax=Synchytrium microbalum TaxID=1806994 RepID=A0A507C2T7_9FUNG|nr:uncharacterized protein SmJEL517_g03724 [Synchytrium microbalum]TPX33359.1 hypothetical protein SmJEL517_g03724 [Synchytrium microbalum]